MQAHGTEADGVSFLVSLGNRRHHVDVGVIRHIGQCTGHAFHRATEIGAVHQIDDISGAEVTRNIGAKHFVFLAAIDYRRSLYLQDFRAEIAHDDLTVDWIVFVSRVDIDDIRVAGFLL